MKPIVINFVKHLLFGSLIILGGIFSYLLIVRTLGYLPYSHAPGPGWYDDYPIVWEEVEFFWDFILTLGIYVVGVLIVFFVLFKLFLRIGYNEKVYSALGAAAFSFSASFLTGITGWFIALDLSTIIVGGSLGSLYGAMLFPFYIKPIEKEKLSN
ncbi:MAG: hypothetical protein ACQETL_16300 [Bacteroidota bacterium]